MNLHMTSGGTFGAGRPSVGDVVGWLNASVFRPESTLRFGRDLATRIRDSIRTASPRCGGARIRVSAMSVAWLRMHETEHHKHCAEL
jgi:hypothetical protein